MSLSVPYVLRAAVEVAPDAEIAVASERLTTAEVSAQTGERARMLYRAGARPSRRYRIEGAGLEAVLDRLAAARCGIVLAAVPDELEAPGAECDVTLLETRVWSESVLLAHEDQDAVTHGAFLDASSRGESPGWWPRDLVDLVRALLHTGRLEGGA